MSHFTTIQTQIRDLEALNDACAEMDLKFVANSNCRGYAGITRQAPHVIQLKGPYDIAVDPPPGERRQLWPDHRLVGRSRRQGSRHRLRSLAAILRHPQDHPRGPLATDIRFCERTQLWKVRCASTGKLLHCDPSREACLAWERANLGPPNPDAQRPAITLPNLKS
jgi:hypothetical protein